MVLFIDLQQASCWFNYEPFAWFEGISVWPTEFLRYIAGTFAWYYLFKGSRELRKNNQTLSKKYFTMEKDTDLGRLWNDYQKKSAFRCRFLRIALTSISYFILCCAIILIQGYPYPPCRGDFNYYVDLTMLLFSVCSLIVLIFWVVDVTKLSRWFIYKISEKGIDWPPETIRRLSFGNYVIPPKHTDDLVNIRIIGEHTGVVGKLIYYPFIVIILMLISQGSYFDNWNLSIGLLIVIMMSLAYSAFCVLVLRHSAKSIRQKAIKKLHIQQIFSKSQTSDLSQPLSLMLDYIRSNREGALAPISHQPFVHALLIFLGSGGSLLLLEYMPWLK